MKQEGASLQYEVWSLKGEIVLLSIVERWPQVPSPTTCTKGWVRGRAPKLWGNEAPSSGDLLAGRKPELPIRCSKRAWTRGTRC